MAIDSSPDIEAQIAEWLGYMTKRRELTPADADELEDHLRSRIADLTEAGLSPDEAFLIAVKRMGSLDALSREFAREHSERLWKQLVLTGGPDEMTAAASRLDLLAMIACAALAAIAIKIPAVFGFTFADDPTFYVRNFSLFALVPLAAYFVWQRRPRPGVIATLAALFVIGAVGANAYPLGDESQSIVLTAIHLPLALWLVMGVAYVGGEWFIYFVLIALGGGVLTAFTFATFTAIGVNPETFVSEWLLPCGAMAAVVIAAWLVEAKKGVIENMAPVLTRVFTPIFAAALLAFAVSIVVTGNGIDIDRDVLIRFNLLLVVVLGLLLYGISARDPAAPPGVFDKVQLALVVTALVIDVLVLAAITGRITEFGFTANKTAALGENVILLVNLAWSAYLLLAMLRARTPFSRLERWQTGYLTVYAAWAWIVVLAFPVIFNFA